MREIGLDPPLEISVATPKNYVWNSFDRVYQASERQLASTGWLLSGGSLEDYWNYVSRAHACSANLLRTDNVTLIHGVA